MVTGDVIASLRVDFSECFSLTCSETSFVRSLVGDTGAGDKKTTDFIGGNQGHLQGSLECAGELAELFTIQMLVKCLLSWGDYFVQTDGDVSGTQVLTTAVLCGRRVELSNHQGSGGQNDFATSSGGCQLSATRLFTRGIKEQEVGDSPATRVFGQQMKVYGEQTEHGEAILHSNVVDERNELARRFIIRASARQVLERHAASEAICGFGEASHSKLLV